MQDNYESYHTVIKGWLKKRTNYAFLARGVARLLRRELVKKDIQFFSIECRRKSLPSTLRKYQRNSFGSLDQITDLAGVRVVCPYVYELDKVVHLVKRLFRLNKVDVITSEAKSRSTGYASFHCLVQWDPKQDGPIMGDDFNSGFSYEEVDKMARNWWDQQRQKANDGMLELICEIQIRTILQHAWANISHEFFYKREKSMPESVRARLRKLGQLLEEIDKAFIEEIKKSTVYLEEPICIPKRRTLRLTKKYLREYSSNALGLPLSQTDSSKALSVAHDIGIRNVEEFEYLMIACLDAIKMTFGDMRFLNMHNLVWYLRAIAYWVNESKEILILPSQEEVLKAHRENVHEDILKNQLRNMKTSRG